MDKHFLEVDSIQKHFNQKTLLSSICIHCYTGNIVGILGRNGSGKSTLLKIIFGIEKAQYQFIRIDNVHLKAAFKHFGEIAYLSQYSFLPKNISVLKVITLYYNDYHDFIANDDFLQPILNTKISVLSGGELRYLECKLLLNLPVKFVLLDEPFSGIAPIIAEKIQTLIKTASQTKGIIMTDHNYDYILQTSTHIKVLKEGTLYDIKENDELKTHGYLATD